MGENTELADWASRLDWSKYASDPEVQVGLKKLRSRVRTLRKSVSSKDGKGKGANPRVKLVIVGDGAVGKTSLLMTYAKGDFPDEYVPTVFENYAAKYKKDDSTTVLLHLWDTAGQEEYDRLRVLSYPRADVVLLCFATVTKSSYESVSEKWFPEVEHFVPNAPKVLVGTKVDLRDDELPDPGTGELDPVTTEEGEELAKKLGLAKYIEVSSKTRKNLDNVFADAVELVLARRAEEKAQAEEESGSGSDDDDDDSATEESASASETPRRAKSPRRKKESDGQSSPSSARKESPTPKEEPAANTGGKKKDKQKGPCTLL